MIPSASKATQVVSSTSASTTLSSVSPFAAGSVSYQNTWNNSQALTCATKQSVSQPLLPVQASWSASVQIPTIMYMNRPLGQFIRQHYTLYPNGTLFVSDDSGNSFTLSVSGYQAVLGAAPAVVVANSSKAILSYQATTTSGILSSVTMSFSILDQYCKPAGLEIAISGSGLWGASSSTRGVISFVLSKNPTLITKSAAWFSSTASQYGSQLGFDWSDSASLNPTFNASANTLSYLVGQNFTIDPKIVGTSTYPYATSNDYGGHVCQAAGRYWFFYVNGTSTPVFQSSTNGSTWTAPAAFAGSSIGGNFSGGLALYCSGLKVYYEGSANSSSVYEFAWGKGSMYSNGTIIWGSSGTVATAASRVQGGSITVDSNNHIWVSQHESYPSARIEVFESSSLEGSSWTNKLTLTGFSSGAARATDIVKLTSGKVALIYGVAVASGGGALSLKQYNSGTWGPTFNTTRTSLYMAYTSAVTISTTIEVATTDGSNVYYYTSGGASWSSPITIAAGSYAGISTDSNSLLVISYLTGSTTLSYVSSSNAGSSWSEPVTVTANEISARAGARAIAWSSDRHACGS
ncbi:MAG TPA: hypothetical protein VFF30_10885 [Nitrososphaerales archaeon]|nr:hypothetical protein [Nitrososphaerales archaeon]